MKASHSRRSKNIRVCTGVLGRDDQRGHKRLILKSDIGPSILKLNDDMRRHVCQWWNAFQVSARRRQPGKRSSRTCRGHPERPDLATEDLFGCKPDPKGGVLAWIPRHSAQLLTRFRVYAGGRTATHRTTDQSWGRPAVTFGG